MLATSTGAAAALGSLQLVTDEIIRSGGGSVVTDVTTESLSPTTASPDAVDFTGTVRLTNTVTGAKGTVPTHDSIDGPLRVERDGSWRVATFTFDGQPLVYYPQGNQATANGIHLTVGFLLSNANATVALVSLRADAPGTTITVQRVQLTLASGAQEVGHAAFGRGVPAGELGFQRTNDSPSRLDVVIRLSNGSTVDLSVALTGASSPAAG